MNYRALPSGVARHCLNLRSTFLKAQALRIVKMANTTMNNHIFRVEEPGLSNQRAIRGTSFGTRTAAATTPTAGPHNKFTHACCGPKKLPARKYAALLPAQKQPRITIATNMFTGQMPRNTTNIIGRFLRSFAAIPLDHDRAAWAGVVEFEG